MASLLVVHHTVAPSLQTCLELTVHGAREAAAQLDETEVDITLKPALAATAMDVLNADAIVLGTPANIGYMSGALKHFFDQIFYPTLSHCKGLPYGMYVHGNDDCAGAVASIQRIAGGLEWTPMGAPVVVTGDVTGEASKDLISLGENLAAAAAGLLPH